MRNHLVLLFYRLCFFTAPRAVACDNLHLRASAHLWHVSAFLRTREFLEISWSLKKSRIYWIFHPIDTGSLILRCSFSKNHMLIPDQNG